MKFSLCTESYWITGYWGVQNLRDTRAGLRPKKNSYVSAVPAGWNFFSAHPGAWEIHYSIFSFHTQIPLLFSALFTLTPAWLNSEVEISGKRNTQSPSISFWQHRIIGKTFFLCLWYDQINVSNTNDGVVSPQKKQSRPPGWDFFWPPATAET